MLFPQPSWLLVDGSLSKHPSEVVILAEDERHRNFVQHYLKGRGFRNDALRFEPLPVGRGCGEQWVRERYANAVKAYRQRAARAKSALVVAIDADVNEVENVPNS